MIRQQWMARAAAGIVLTAAIVFAGGKAAFSQNDAPLKISRNVSYMAQGGDPKLNTLDIYAPAGQTQRPVVVFIHGGGWVIGDKVSGSRGKAEAFAHQGYVFVSINYRLAPAVKHPVLEQDCARAIAWVHENIAKYGGDPNRMFVMGHSAGAHLAALLSTDAHYLKDAGVSPKILHGCILLDGAGYDLTGKEPIEPITRRFAHATFGDDSAVRKDASPVYHAAPGQDIPPFLIIYVAARDISHRQTDALAKALTTANVPVEIKAAYGKNHGTLSADLGKADDVPTEQVYAFLEKQLR